MNSDHALGFWTIGKQFLQLADLSSSRLIETGNLHLLVSRNGHTIEEYDQITAWSDHNVGIPILFDFYHGIEVMIKGFLVFKDKPCQSHKFSVLVATFEKLAPESDILKTVKSFTTEVPPESFIARFLETNNISIDAWYEALKYPVSKKGQEFGHYDLKYGEDETIKFWREIQSASKRIISESYGLCKAWDAV